MASLRLLLVLTLIKWMSPQMLPRSLFFIIARKFLCVVSLLCILLFSYEYKNFVIVVCICISFCGSCLCVSVADSLMLRSHYHVMPVHPGAQQIDQKQQVTSSLTFDYGAVVRTQTGLG